MRFAKLVPAILVAALPFAAPAQDHSQHGSSGMTKADRDYLIAYLQKTAKEFVSSIEGLTPQQWSYKPASGGWSIAECAEHITLSEDALFGLTNNMLKAPAQPNDPPRTREMDEKIIAGLTDRSRKAQAPEMLKPSGKFPTPASAVTQFMERRNRSLEFARTTQENLRGRVQKNQIFGTVDAYQFLLYMAAHSSRHTAQLNEVKTDANYPK
jgi:hypothetical protein